MRHATAMKSLTTQSGEDAIRYLCVEDLLIASVEYQGSQHFLWNKFARLISEFSELIHGAPFCLFHENSRGRNQEIECCIPVRPFMGIGDTRTRILRGAPMLTWIHHGSFQTLGESWERLFDFIEGRNIKVNGPRREIYLGVHSPDGNIMRAELQVPVLEASEYEILYP